MTHRNRLNTLLWTGAVIVATALSLVLMLQVKAVNSEIAETDKAIMAAQQQIAVLETEFQTRARQQQLVRWNEVDFGYVAPKASQFLDGRSQLAALGKPVEIIESEPIRMAAAATEALAESEMTVGQAPVRVASAETPAAAPVLKGDAEAAGVRENTLRLAAAPPMMRQLAARENAPSRQSVQSVEPVRRKSFAERFDLDSVIEGAR